MAVEVAEFLGFKADLVPQCAQQVDYRLQWYSLHSSRGVTGRGAGGARPLHHFTLWQRTCLKIEAQHTLH